MVEYPKRWDDDVVMEYIQPESTQKDPQQFRKTHLDFDRIKYDRLVPPPETEEFITQEYLRDAVIDSEVGDDNRIFIITGEVGSGKSHLCQWLEYEINGYGEQEPGISEDHVAIHVSRSNTEIASIVNKLYEPLDESPDDIGGLEGKDPEKIADLIATAFDAVRGTEPRYAGFDAESFVAPVNGNDDDFRSMLARNIQEYQQQSDDDDITRSDFLTRSEFNRVCVAAFGEAKGDDAIYKWVKADIHDTIAVNLGVGGFAETLSDLADLYEQEGLRPVLIADDLTTFNVLKESLLQSIFDLSSGQFDIVLGWTLGWERENIDTALPDVTGDALTYMKERVTGYLRMSDTEVSYFLSDGAQGPIELVRRYLDVIKEESGFDPGDQPGFDDLYPFNEAFITYAFQELVEGGNPHRTPRTLLNEVVRACLLSKDPPFMTVETKSTIDDRPRVTMNDNNEQDDLIKWYATLDDEDTVVDQDIFRSFGLSTDGLRALDGKVRSAGLSPFAEEHLIGEGEGSGSAGPVDPPGPEPPSSTHDAEYTDLQGWIQEGEGYPSVDKFKRGISMNLQKWTSPRRLGNGRSTTANGHSVFFTRGDAAPLVIEGVNKPRSPAITVEQDQEFFDVYLRFLDDSLELGQRRGRNPAREREWCLRKVDALRSEMWAEIEGPLPDGMGFDEFLVITKFLLMNAGQGVTTIDKEMLFAEYEMNPASPLQADEAGELRETFNTLTRHSSNIDGLLAGFFTLKSKVIDHARVDAALKNVEIHLSEYLDKLRTIAVSDMKESYKVGSTAKNANKSLKTLYRDVGDYVSSLLRTDLSSSVEVDIERFREIESLLDTAHTMGELSEAFRRLQETMGPLDVTNQSRWDDTLAQMESDGSLDVSGLIDGVESLTAIDGEDPIMDMAMATAWAEVKTRSTTWRAYVHLQEMLMDLESRSPDEGVTKVEEAIRDSEEHRAFGTEIENVRGVVEGLR